MVQAAGVDCTLTPAKRYEVGKRAAEYGATSVMLTLPAEHYLKLKLTEPRFKNLYRVAGPARGFQQI